MVLSERTCTGQLTSHPQSRDIQFENFSLLFHGHELIQDSTLELNYGRSGRKLPAYFGTALGGHLLRIILSSPADVRCQASAMSPRPCLTPACSISCPAEQNTSRLTSQLHPLAWHKFANSFRHQSLCSAAFWHPSFHPLPLQRSQQRPWMHAAAVLEARRWLLGF